MKGEIKMLVYVVCYENDLGIGIWGIYNSVEKADAIVNAIKIDCQYKAWYNAEEVL